MHVAGEAFHPGDYPSCKELTCWSAVAVSWQLLHLEQHCPAQQLQVRWIEAVCAEIAGVLAVLAWWAGAEGLVHTLAKMVLLLGGSRTTWAWLLCLCVLVLMNLKTFNVFTTVVKCDGVRQATDV